MLIDNVDKVPVSVISRVLVSVLVINIIFKLRMIYPYIGACASASLFCRGCSTVCHLRFSHSIIYRLKKLYAS